MTKKISVMAMVTLLSLSASLIPLYANPAQLIQTTEVLSVSYFLSEMIYGYKEHPLGKLEVCVELKDSSVGRRIISVEVSMPDSGQVLSADAPIKTLKNEEISFEFADDGWGNAGRGRLTIFGNKADLTLQQTSWPPDADRNISRNYGHFELMKGQCYME